MRSTNTAAAHTFGLMPQHESSIVYLPIDAAGAWETGPGLEDVRVERVGLERGLLGS
jgi:hypothetical protein